MSSTYGAARGLHSKSALIAPSLTSVRPAFVASNEIMIMSPSLPYVLPAAFNASIAPNASLSF